MSRQLTFTEFTKLGELQIADLGLLALYLHDRNWELVVIKASAVYRRAIKMRDSEIRQ